VTKQATKLMRQCGKEHLYQINLAILPHDNAATLLFACQIRELNTQFYDLAKNVTSLSMLANYGRC
jgi:hypothetical protein